MNASFFLRAPSVSGMIIGGLVRNVSKGSRRSIRTIYFTGLSYKTNKE